MSSKWAERACTIKQTAPTAARSTPRAAAQTPSERLTGRWSCARVLSPGTKVSSPAETVIDVAPRSDQDSAQEPDGLSERGSLQGRMCAGGPVDFDAIDRAGIPQADEQPRVARGQIAAPPLDLPVMDTPTGVNLDRRADGRAVR